MYGAAERVDGVAEALGVAEQRRDVVKENALLREIGNSRESLPSDDPCPLSNEC
jgi:hypothetical protein